jgi:hypothetical protein
VTPSFQATSQPSFLPSSACLKIHETRDFLGEGCLRGQPLRLATGAMMTDCVIMRIEKSAMVQVPYDQSSFTDLAPRRIRDFSLGA